MTKLLLPPNGADDGPPPMSHLHDLSDRPLGPIALAHQVGASLHHVATRLRERRQQESYALQHALELLQARLGSAVAVSALLAGREEYGAIAHEVHALARTVQGWLGDPIDALGHASAALALTERLHRVLVAATGRVVGAERRVASA